jgi:methylmalonyl-CoA/ethylmalonyl-CoA epimerase
MAFFNCDGIRLLLDEVDEWQHPSSILYYQVADLQDIYQALVQKGLEFKEKPHLVANMPDHELWMAFFEDPSGNTLALMSEIPYEI